MPRGVRVKVGAQAVLLHLNFVRPRPRQGREGYFVRQIEFSRSMVGGVGLDPDARGNEPLS